MGGIVESSFCPFGLGLGVLKYSLGRTWRVVGKTHPIVKTKGGQQLCHVTSVPGFFWHLCPQPLTYVSCPCISKWHQVSFKQGGGRGRGYGYMPGLCLLVSKL
jgi:hypothetical protein